MKIGLVTPYIYPLPGGVNAHVRFLYDNLIARGHDVRGDLARLVTSRAWPLLELHQVGMSLEEVFIRVVAGEEAAESAESVETPTATAEVA